MPTHIHFICKHGEHFHRIGGSQYETGDWKVSDETADEIVQSAGWVYLHEKQKDKAWHGGQVASWRLSNNEDLKKVFTYNVIGDFRIHCLNGWGHEQAIRRE